jgi:transcriptional regulator with XRE-family HTH domain
MGTRERPLDRARRAADHHRAEAAREIRLARINAGLSQRAVAKEARVSHATVGRVERNQEPELSLDLLDRLASVVGLEMTVRFYPSGDPIRDAAHVALLARLRARLHPTLRWRTEVPLPIAGDRRAWDAVIAGPGWTIGVEAETRLRDVQAVVRKVALKARDGQLNGLILLLADTRSNRAAVRAAADELDGFRVHQRDALAALADGRGPDGDVLLIL